MSVDDIVSTVEGLLVPERTWRNTPICFTGGEPTLQLDETLLRALSAMGYTHLHLETNGSLIPPAPTMFECITISPKDVVHIAKPLQWPYLLSLRVHRELKIVWDTRNLTRLRAIVESWKQFTYVDRFIQPLTLPDGSSNVEEVMDFIKRVPDWRISVQLHKILKVR